MYIILFFSTHIFKHCNFYSMWKCYNVKRLTVHLRSSQSWHLAFKKYPKYCKYVAIASPGASCAEDFDIWDLVSNLPSKSETQPAAIAVEIGRRWYLSRWVLHGQIILDSKLSYWLTFKIIPTLRTVCLKDYCCTFLVIFFFFYLVAC